MTLSPTAGLCKLRLAALPNSQVSMASGARECAEATPSIRHERQEIVLCQISRPTAPALTGGLIGWQTIKATFAIQVERMGAVEGVHAGQFGPIMAGLARPVASTVSLGAVLQSASLKIESRDLGLTVVASRQNGPD